MPCSSGPAGAEEEINVLIVGQSGHGMVEGEALSEPHGDDQQAVRELAYFLWEREGRPDGRDAAYWERANELRSEHHQTPDDPFEMDAEAIVEGSPHADFPALMTKDVSGG